MESADDNAQLIGRLVRHVALFDSQPGGLGRVRIGQFPRVLQPGSKLDLPDNTPVQVQVTPLPVGSASSRSLFGAFPELAVLTANEFAWAKRLWEHGLEKQARLLDGLV